MSSIQFDRIALIGIGLIGSSIAHDIKRLGIAKEVVISTRSAETLKRAEELQLGDRYTPSSADAVKDADLVIVSVPVGASESVAKEIAAHLKPGAIVTDVGSTKASVIAQMQPHMPPTVHFIPGHPLAGTRVDWEELKRHRQILVAARGDGPEKQRLRVAAEVWWVESHWVILQLVKQGIGWAFVSSYVIANSPVTADLVTPDLQFDDFDLPVALEMVWHKQRPCGPAARWLRERFASARIGAA